MLAAGCAPLPPAPEPQQPTPPKAAPTARPAAAQRGPVGRTAFIARQTELARSAQASGDFARAEDHWEVLTLLEPDDAGFRQSLASVRQAVQQGARDHWQAGSAALRQGDTARARDAFLRTLALDPEHAGAAKALRDIEHQLMARLQMERAARARSLDESAAMGRSRPARGNDSAVSPSIGGGANAAVATFDLEQRLELLHAGDLDVGLRELRSWVDANPGDRNGRQRAGAAVAERARDAEAKGRRENALSLYEQAVAIAGTAAAEWSARIQSLRRALGEHYYTEGMKLYRTDLAGAIREWENGAKLDPTNTNLQVRLREARLIQQKLQKIGNR